MNRSLSDRKVDILENWNADVGLRDVLSEKRSHFEK